VNKNANKEKKRFYEKTKQKLGFYFYVCTHTYIREVSLLQLVLLYKRYMI